MPVNFFQQALEYSIDAWQRSVLFLDTLGQASSAQNSTQKNITSNVLHFEFELILDGRTFDPPVNYQLLHIVPIRGVPTDPSKRPFIVFDPRAGHGPGIGGMKEDSEVGSALRAGHPCYFVSFLQEPVPGQTVEQVCKAEAVFIKYVTKEYPKASKPCLIGNCQAGWQIAMTSSLFPDLAGVLILAGAPLSYWGGVHGKYPLRYTGGMTAGSWSVSLASDLGKGRFDGAALIENFEKMNPANTHWKKGYNLYSKVDTEAPRFLNFERWWGQPISLSGEEIKFIVNNLFIGNLLSSAELKSSEGSRIDLRNIKSPIVVFCSHGDEITPPQQALGWILDLYKSDTELLVAGQTIIYCLHRDIGHLGIFVASSVAEKEHDKFVRTIDMIETLPPGLYEATFTDKTRDMVCADLASGNYVLRFEPRRLDDLRALGGNSEDDNRCFATVKRVSDINSGIYEMFAAPFIRAVVTEQGAKLNQEMHALRVRYRMLSNENIFMTCIPPLAKMAKDCRSPVPVNNVFWQMQETFSAIAISVLEYYGDLRNFLVEESFFNIYSSPFLQAFVGLRATHATQKTVLDLDRESDVQKQISQLKKMSLVGGMPEATMRALLYVLRGGKGFDERQFNFLLLLCKASPYLPQSQTELKDLIRRQHAILEINEKEAMHSLTKLLEKSSLEERKETLTILHVVLKAQGELYKEEQDRLVHLDTHFMVGPTPLSP